MNDDMVAITEMAKVYDIHIGLHTKRLGEQICSMPACYNKFKTGDQYVCLGIYTDSGDFEDNVCLSCGAKIALQQLYNIHKILQAQYIKVVH